LVVGQMTLSGQSSAYDDGMEISLRAVQRDEFKQFINTITAAFAEEATDEELEHGFKLLDPNRALAALDGDSMVGVAGAFDFVVTVPGPNKVRAAGVTVVGVLPSHRRRGILTRMMEHQLEDIHTRGEPIAILGASESNIYQRFGYGIATLQSSIDIERDRAGFRTAIPASGRFRLLDTDKAIDVLADVYDRVCAQTPGMYERTRAWWEHHSLHDSEPHRHGGGPLFRAVWELDGRPEAYALYRDRRDFDWRHGVPTGHLHVLEAMGTSPLATREIWSFIFGIDLTERIRADREAGLPPLMFMLDEPRRLRISLSDGIYVRIVDIKSALEARSYLADGSVVFEVNDAQLPHNNGRWKVDVSGGRATVEKTSSEPDIITAITDLGSVYLGGFTFAQMSIGDSLHEAVPGALRRADQIFRTDVQPWCPEEF
jgi:predicted acetyltransferase